MARFSRHWSSLTSVPFAPCCSVGRVVVWPHTVVCAVVDVPWVAQVCGPAAQVFNAAQVCGPSTPSTPSPAHRWKSLTRAADAGPNEPSAAIGVYLLGFVARLSWHCASTAASPVDPCCSVGCALVCPQTATAAVAADSAACTAVGPYRGRTAATARVRPRRSVLRPIWCSPSCESPGGPGREMLAAAAPKAGASCPGWDAGTVTRRDLRERITAGMNTGYGRRRRSLPGRCRGARPRVTRPPSCLSGGRRTPQDFRTTGEEAVTQTRGSHPPRPAIHVATCRTRRGTPD
jgi:hypothetical protein